MLSRDKIWLAVLGLILVIALVVTIVSVIRSNDEPSDVARIFETANTYEDFTGESVDLTPRPGEVVVLTTWASWSPFTTTDLPAYDALAAEYANQRVRFVAVNRAEPRVQAERMLQTLPELNHLQVVLDANDAFYDAIAGYAMPETIVFGPTGNIALHHHGQLDVEELRLLINDILE